jgi:hypothetical protein
LRSAAGAPLVGGSGDIRFNKHIADLGGVVLGTPARSAKRASCRAPGLSLHLRPLPRLAQVKNREAPAVKREAEEDWGRGK